MDKELTHSLHDFIVRAKAATYVGGGAHSTSSRPGSHDLQFTDGDWVYLDSYFGGTDFIGQEVVYHAGKPVWALNYYGFILRPDLITGAETGQMIQHSLARMYAEKRFLGGFQHTEGALTYIDTSEGDVTHLTGKEWIEREGLTFYELHYHGGLIKD
jgi:hypothetical protein